MIFVLAGPLALSQEATITPNYKDADIRQVIEAVGEVTGKNFVLDPRVKAQVTMLSSAPMTPDAFYEAFLSILQVYGYVAVPSGNLIKVLPDANARQVPGSESGKGGRRRADDIITQVIPVRNIAAAQLVPILRPLIPQYGHLAAHPGSNMLIISDRAANVDRMLRIIRRIDQAGDDDFEVMRLEHASASEIVRIVTALNQGPRTDPATGGASTTVVADDRTNSVLISGDKNERLRIRTLVTHLDTPLEEGGDTRVRYLRYAEAEELATKLQAQYQPKAAAEGAPPAESGDINIWADESTNALIMTAPPKIMRSIKEVIDRLDIRRMQVLLEAIIVEVASGSSSDLGVTWAIADANFETAIGATQFAGNVGVTGLIGAVAGEDPTATQLNDGISLGLGRLSDSGTSFAAIIEALESDANSNILGTPILTTLDNEEAEIRVGEEVPFVTGSFTNTGTAGSAVNPFQTVEREQVGLSLKITPQINEGNAVILKIEQEVSALSDSTTAVDLITTNRVINTSVIVEDQGTLVLGGLIREDSTEGEQRVPILGSIPILGLLFRSTSTDTRKVNLMFFVKPTILRDDVQAAFYTGAKYNYIRELQLTREPDTVLPEFRSAPVIAIPEQTFPAAESPSEPVIDLRDLKPAEPPTEE